MLTSSSFYAISHKDDRANLQIYKAIIIPLGNIYYDFSCNL